MSNHGKKVGKFRVSTVLARYDLDVRLDMEQNVFTILVPRNPGEPVNTKLGHGINYDSFSGSTLVEFKKRQRIIVPYATSRSFRQPSTTRSEHARHSL